MTKNNYDNLLADYKLIKPLGEGGMGEVFLAEDIHLSRKVAIKFLKTEQESQNDLMVKRFRNEAKILASLSHPNIVSIFNFGTKDNINYIVMEYVEGTTLTDLIKEKNHKIEEIVQIITKIVKGICEAHAKGVLHRDLKPANIIITKNKEAKIVDFGISKSILSDQNEYTQTNHFIGTVTYMAPELLMGHPPSMESDIFSLGVIFYEMLIGKNPYSGDNKFKIIEKIKSTQLELSPEFKLALPQELVKIFLKMTALDKKNRYKSSMDLLIDLKNVMTETGTLVFNTEEEDEIDRLMKKYSNRPDPLTLDEARTESLEISDLHFDNIELTSNRANELVLKNKNEKKAEKDPVSVKPQGDESEIGIDPTRKKPLFTPLRIVLVLSAVIGFIAFKYLSLLSGAGAQNLKEHLSSYVNKKKVVNSATDEIKLHADKVTQTNLSLEEPQLSLPLHNSYLLFDVIRRNEQTGKVLKKGRVGYQFEVKNRDIASVNVHDQSNKWTEFLQVTANSFVPPIKYKNLIGREQNIKLSGDYNAIYPLNIGKKMTYSTTSLLPNGQFSQINKECHVLGRENVMINNIDLETYRAECREIGVEKPVVEMIHYAPSLRYFVKKESRVPRLDGYHVEVMKLVNYKLPKAP